MNVERVNAAADRIESLDPKNFDMEVFYDCYGKPSCMVGHIHAMALETDQLYNTGDSTKIQIVARFLDASEDDIVGMAYPSQTPFYHKRSFEIDNIQAGKVLRHYALTGEVNHLIGMEE